MEIAYIRCGTYLQRSDLMKTVFIAEDPRSKATLDLAKRAAKSNANILISGDTGVGKEVLSRFIHANSPFAEGPFISINCAAMPDNMMEAILFGHEKGAFTNAISNYVGKFEQAHNGTLLLDEISEIPLGLQAKLLRALQEREIERLGGKKIISINARIIAATNKNLHQQAMAGLFRKDLYYRLNVIHIHCAALKDRILDILPLAEHFFKKYANAFNRAIPVLTESAKKKMLRSAWPGNTREMENVIQRTLIMTERNIIDHDDIILCEDIFESDEQHTLIKKNVVFSSTLAENEANTIINVLQEVDGSRSIAAKKLNISPRTLRHKISKLKSIGLKVP